MSTYRISFWEEQGGFIYFEAENLEQAKELFEQLENGEIFDEDLPNAVRKVKNGQCEYSLLEEAE
jgi:uncharacterized protein with ACT and thioredoxin-like domain